MSGGFITRRKPGCVSMKVEKEPELFGKLAKFIAKVNGGYVLFLPGFKMESESGDTYYSGTVIDSTSDEYRKDDMIIVPPDNMVYDILFYATLAYICPENQEIFLDALELAWAEEEVVFDI